LELFVLIEVTRMLGLPDLGVDDDLWTFGLDSLGAIELSETLSRAMASNLTVNDFIGASTVAAISKRIAESRPSKPSNMVTLVESESEPSVFIMTGAGSPALRYRELAHGVGKDAGVVGFEQWGLLQRTRPDRSVGAAAKRNVRHIVDVAGDGPLVLIGHSWGGHVAHEMAVQLTETGREVLLVILDSGRSQRGKWNHNLPAVLQSADSNWLQRHKTIARWRLYWILRPRLSWLMRDDRFQRFFWRGIRTARRHRAGVFLGPMLVVQAETSTVGQEWLDQPGVRIATTTDDHNSMCHAPHVQGLADIVNTFITSYLADGSAARG
jgi:thioesterase domain-containing protein/aryl carrier-like protein